MPGRHTVPTGHVVGFTNSRQLWPPGPEIGSWQTTWRPIASHPCSPEAQWCTQGMQVASGSEPEHMNPASHSPAQHRWPEPPQGLVAHPSGSGTTSIGETLPMSETLESLPASEEVNTSPQSRPSRKRQTQLLPIQLDSRFSLPQRDSRSGSDGQPSLVWPVIQAV